MFWSCSVDKIRTKFVYYRVLRYLFVLVLLQFITVTQFSYTEKRPRLRTCLCTRGHRLKYIVTDLRVGCRGAKACDPIDRFRWTNRNIRASGCAKPFRRLCASIETLIAHILSFIVHNFPEPYENVHFPSRCSMVPATCYTTTAVNTCTKTFSWKYIQTHQHTSRKDIFV